MNRPWQTWMIFVICITTLFGAMTWVSVKVLELEAKNQEAMVKAQEEENVRIALWRMDSLVSYLVVQENSRPYYDYNAFYPVEQAIPNIAANDNSANPTLIPSPILVETPTNILLNFVCMASDTTGQITSPQVPMNEQFTWSLDAFGNGIQIDNNKKRLKTIQTRLNGQRLAKQLANIQKIAPQTSLQSINQDIQHSVNQSEDEDNLDIADQIIAQQSAQQDFQPQAQTGAINSESQVVQADSYAWGAQKKSAQENQRRNIMNSKLQSRAAQGKANRYEQVNTSWNKNSTDQQELVYDNLNDSIPVMPKGRVVPELVKEDNMRPFWVDDMLLIARQVNIDGQKFIQGAWLDWADIKSELLGEISDMFPDAELLPITAGVRGPESRMLASLPVQLVPGTISGQTYIASGLQFPLLIAWACVVLAALAVAILLSGTIIMSERRGAFVSAVTHELRTPLTTFRMYTEMLSEGIIKDEAKKKEYVDTLHKESNRLGHLVENVLAYARLERGTGARSLETLKVGDMLDRMRALLNTRCNQAEMTLSIELADADKSTHIHTDQSAVEQILFNLVDNACKYAASAEDSRIHLTTARQGRHMTFRVCDHGEGLPRHEAKRLFKPFRKSAQAAAQSAPGVGLGLALCRQLARQLGGDLTYEDRAESGACFVLRLPCR